MADAVIEVKELDKWYGKNHALRQVTLSVERGEIFGFLGANGAGKSTLIRCLLGLIGASSGEVTLFGGAYKNKAEELAHIGYLPSESQFYPDMKVGEVITFAARARKQDCRAEAERICQILEVPVNKKIKDLSLGNRKKVSIVCALQHKPSLLILDEPTSGLDPLMQERFFGLVKQACAEGATCFLSSHQLMEVKQYCHRAAIIKEGSLLVLDSVEQLMRSQSKRVTVWKDGVEEQFHFEGQSSDLLQRLLELEPSDFLVEEPSLEERFLHYYGEDAE